MQELDLSEAKQAIEEKLEPHTSVISQKHTIKNLKSDLSSKAIEKNFKFNIFNNIEDNSVVKKIQKIIEKKPTSNDPASPKARIFKFNQFNKSAAYLIPAIIIIIVIWINIFPLGIGKTVTLKVGQSGDTDGVLYVKQLGTPQTIDGVKARGVQDIGYIGFKPAIELAPETKIQFNLKGNGVYWETLTDITGDDILEWQNRQWRAEASLSVYNQIQGEEADTISGVDTFALFFNKQFAAGDILISGDIAFRVTAANLLFSSISTGRQLIPLPAEFLGQEKEVVLVYDGQYHIFIDTIKKATFKGTKPNNIIAGYTKILTGFDPLQETVPIEDNCAILDGKSQLILPNSRDEFETNAFTVALDYIPTKNQSKIQSQIIGHYNWEILQAQDAVSFRVGRTNPEDKFYTIQYPVGEDFFGQKHTIVAVYQPANETDTEGYIKLYIDNLLVGKTSLAGATMRTDYSRDLTIGRGYHGGGNTTFFEGQVCNPRIFNNVLTGEQREEITLPYSLAQGQISIAGEGYISELKAIINPK
jgi:hypothetical protein